MTLRRLRTAGFRRLCVAILISTLPVSAALAGTTERVSVGSGEVEGNGFSAFPTINGDGRLVAFWSLASNLVADDDNGVADVFVRDRDTGETTLISVSSDGDAGNGESALPSISKNGRFVTFKSAASNLVVGDSNVAVDIFVHELAVGRTERVSVADSGAQANGDSSREDLPVISAGGRFVAFSSSADNLVSGDNNGVTDIFVVDRRVGTIRRVSVAGDGTEANGRSTFPSISGDGQIVAFRSEASNLVAADSNSQPDIFVHELASGVTRRVSVSDDGREANGASSRPAVSHDGRHVAFWSAGSNLVADDFNGAQDTFVHELETDRTVRVSVDSTGVGGNGDSTTPAISGDGRLVAFRSDASDLVTDDHNGVQDIFVHDRKHGSTARVSVRTDGAEADGVNFEPAISADGRFVAYPSSAGNLVEADTNRFWDVFVHDRAVPLAVDFKPHDPSNVVSPMADGLVGVLLKSTQVAHDEAADLDAPEIDPATVQVGPKLAGALDLTPAIRDFDADGDHDVILRVALSEMGLGCADSNVEVMAETYDGALQAGTDSIVPTGCGERRVQMDFKPHDPRNRASLTSSGLVGIGILSTSRSAGDELDFDAREVDVQSVRIGPADTNARPAFARRDVDGDGDLDMVVRVRIVDLGLTCTDRWIEIQGMTKRQLPFSAVDRVRTSGCRR